MEKEQQLEWAEAQKIQISKDLVAAAKQQLHFLATVDRSPCFYDGPVLDRAIYRYKYYWLPLLAKHAKFQVTEGPLVVPVDCEWIWHCHRLSPVRYKTDCEELYGKILDNWNVVSSIQGTCTKYTEEIWNRMYPNEPYELKLSNQMSPEVAENIPGAPESTKYDLVSAVKRQSPFFYQVSRPNMNDDLFLEGAVARYKGFLHLVKRNRERSNKRFCVPTYDIDLIWHSHQLHSVSYCKDLVAIMGKVLQHDDTDSDRTEGKKLDVGFSRTTKQWEETFGLRYWRAGAMYRGSLPSPLTINLGQLNTVSKTVVPFDEYQNIIRLPKKMLMEIMLEIVAVRDLPAAHKGSLFVSFSKKQPDLLFNTSKRLSIFSESGEKQVAVFQCEPTGELIIELESKSHSPIARPALVLGTASISLQDLLNPVSKLLVEKWFELVPNSGVVGSKPISLRIALSFTAPVPAPYVLHMVQTRPFSQTCPFSPSSCFALPGRFQQAKSTCVVDDAGNEIISIQMRDSMKTEVRNDCLSKKEVIGMTTAGETHVLGEFVGTGWSLMNSNWFFQLQKKFSEDDDHIFELTGSRKVIIVFGRKLEYETKNCEKHRNEQNFMTTVEFSEENPRGKAVALLNLKSGFIEVKEEWLVLPGIISAFILSDIVSKDGRSGFTPDGKYVRETDNALKEDSNSCNEEYKRTNQITTLGRLVDVKDKEGIKAIPIKGCTRSRMCGDEHDVLVKSVKYGECGGCAGCVDCSVDVEEEADDCDHENRVKSGGCGGCGGGCGGGVGGKCGGGCCNCK